MLWKRKSRRMNPQPGQSYVRLRGSKVLERVRVVDVCLDSFGIPHIHYSSTCLREYQGESENQRVLAKSTFCERFRPDTAALTAS